MSDQKKSLNTVLRIVHIILNLLLAVPSIGIGAMTLISPDVPAEALTENAIVGVALLATAAVLIYDVFRPFSGGLLLLVWAVAFAILFNGFHLSEALLKSREVGYSPFWSGTTGLLIVLGLLSVVRARIGRDVSRHT